MLAAATVRSYMLVLRQLFGWLTRKGWIRVNPTAEVKLPRARARGDHLHGDEVAPVLNALSEISPAIAPMAALIVLGGWREGEIINPRHRDCHLTTRWASVLDFEGDELTEAWSPNLPTRTPLLQEWVDKINVGTLTVGDRCHLYATASEPPCQPSQPRGLRLVKW